MLGSELRQPGFGARYFLTCQTSGIPLLPLLASGLLYCFPSLLGNPAPLPKSVHKQMHSIVSQNMKLICWVTFFWRARGGEEYSRDLSSATRGWTWALAVKAPSPDHWTARKFPWVTFKYAQLVQKTILLWGLVSLIIPFSFNLKVEYYFLLFSKCNILGV